MSHKIKHPTIPLGPQDIPDEVYCVGIDLAKWLTGVALVKANLATNERALLDWQLIQPKSYFLDKIHKDYQYTQLGHLLISAICGFIGRNGIPSDGTENSFIGIETIFLGRNAQTMIDTAYIRGCVASYFSDWYGCGFGIDIAPTTMKMSVTHGFEGNGHSKKHHIAAILKEKYQLDDETFKAMTTLEKPRSTQTVYDVTDALGLADTLVTELRYKKGLK